ncbi:MAG: hypothetical protein GXP55_06260 [Deltaproteobacteria bacterium]|nr:hypothetical protein [Deltaproteobacteria bacterium]
MRELDRRRFLWTTGALLLGGCAGSAPVSTLTCPAPELDEYGTQTRQTVHYVDRAPAGAGRCADCRFWLGAEPGACGRCHLVRGPIHPAGSCDIFRAKQPADAV